MEKAVDPLISLQFMPARFTLTELQRAQELLIGESLDKRNFRKRMLASGLIEATGEKKRTGAHRPAGLYRVQDRSDVPYR